MFHSLQILREIYLVPHRICQECHFLVPKPHTIFCVLGVPKGAIPGSRVLDWASEYLFRHFPPPNVPMCNQANSEWVEGIWVAQYCWMARRVAPDTPITISPDATLKQVLQAVGPSQAVRPEQRYLSASMWLLLSSFVFTTTPQLREVHATANTSPTPTSQHPPQPFVYPPKPTARICTRVIANADLPTHGSCNYNTVF